MPGGDRRACAASSQAVVERGECRSLRMGIIVERRLHARPGCIAVDMRKQSLNSRHKLLAVEQFADRYRGFERSRIARAPRLRTEVRIEVGGRRYAARE